MIEQLQNVRQIPGGGQKEVYLADHAIYGSVVYKKIFPSKTSSARTLREVRAVSLMENYIMTKLIVST